MTFNKHPNKTYNTYTLADLEEGVWGAPPPLILSKIRVLGDIYTHVHNDKSAHISVNV